MKWSREKEKEFEQIINYIIKTVENKRESGEIPDWVVVQLEKRLNKINDCYDMAKKSGWKSVASLVIALGALPLSLIFKPEESVIVLAVLSSIMGLNGCEQHITNRKNYIETAQESQKELVKWICGISDAQEEDYNISVNQVPGNYVVDLPQDMKKYFVWLLNNDFSR